VTTAKPRRRQTARRALLRLVLQQASRRGRFSNRISHALTITRHEAASSAIAPRPIAIARGIMVCIS
jgi:hypothetical protein